MRPPSPALAPPRAGGCPPRAFRRFAIYVAGPDKVSLGSSSSFYGVVYAPLSSLALSGGGEFFGAFVGGSASLGSRSKVHYDSTLRGK